MVSDSISFVHLTVPSQGFHSLPQDQVSVSTTPTSLLHQKQSCCSQVPNVHLWSPINLVLSWFSSRSVASSCKCLSSENSHWGPRGPLTQCPCQSRDVTASPRGGLLKSATLEHSSQGSPPHCQTPGLLATHWPGPSPNTPLQSWALWSHTQTLPLNSKAFCKHIKDYQAFRLISAFSSILGHRSLSEGAENKNTCLHTILHTTLCSL